MPAMVIERIIEQIKAANWTVVVIELLVVFVGVYGAFQLERWGEEWREARYERTLLEQLHGEIVLAVPLMENQVRSKTETESGIERVATLLMQPPGSGDFSAEQCAYIFGISIMLHSPLTLISLDELTSSGVHSQLDDHQLRTLLFTLKSRSQQSESLIRYIGPNMITLMDEYPELIPRGVDSEGAPFMHCHADGMRNNQAFINHLMSNYGRQRGVVGRLEREFDALVQVHVRLDEVLGISHTD